MKEAVSVCLSEPVRREHLALAELCCVHLYEPVRREHLALAELCSRLDLGCNYEGGRVHLSIRARPS